MREYLSKLGTAAERWRTRCFEALGFTPSAELYALSEAYNDELRERLMLKKNKRKLLLGHITEMLGKPGWGQLNGMYFTNYQRNDLRKTEFICENYSGRFGGAAVAGQTRHKGQPLEEAEVK